MPNAAIQLNGVTEYLAITGRSSLTETPKDIAKLESLGQLHILQNSAPAQRGAVQPEIARHSAPLDFVEDRQTLEHRQLPQSPGHDRLLNS